MRQTSSISLSLVCAGLMLAVSGCAGPPPGPPIVLHRVAAQSHPRPRRPEPCEPSVQAKLTEAQKANLFDQFDAWQRERRPAGAPAETALPPPGPLPKTTTTASRACRTASP